MGLTSHQRRKQRSRHLIKRGAKMSRDNHVVDYVSKLEEACRSGPFLVLIQDKAEAKAVSDYYRKICNLPVVKSK